jgi:hypothetical protein
MYHLPDSSSVHTTFHPSVHPPADRKSPNRTPSNQFFHCRRSSIVLFALLSAALSYRSHSQTPSTGALAGVTFDSSGALLPGAALTLANQGTGQTRTAVSDDAGRFGFLLLAPGTYELCARKADFAKVCSSGININVTETRRLELRLQLAKVMHHVEVSAETQMVQTDNSALGRVVNETAVSGPEPMSFPF